MQSILELAPLIAFFVAYSLGGIYVATSVLMAAMALLLVVDFIRHRKVSTMHAISAVLVFAFGAATLILHDQRFIQWKPTVFFWLVSIALLGSMWIGKQPLVQRLMGHLLEGQVQVPDSTWRRVNLLWAVFYALLGGLNLIVAFNTSEATWVKFKVIGLTAATFVFSGAQIFWLMRRTPAEQPSTPSP
jgi:intracellular septation protein